LLTPFSSGVTQVDGGGIETCFLQNNDVYCFGLNDNGQMGIVADSQKYGPQKINGISGVVKQVAAGSRRGCAATEDKVYCWGFNGDNVIDSSNTNDQAVPKVVYTRK
jgi:serine/threonine-protein kinase